MRHSLRQLAKQKHILFSFLWLHCHPTVLPSRPSQLMRSEFRADDPAATHHPLNHYSLRLDLRPLNKQRILTPRQINSNQCKHKHCCYCCHWTDISYHKAACIYPKHHNPHMYDHKKKKHHLTWNGSGCLTCRKSVKTCHVADDPARTGAVWWEELWRSKLGSRCEYQKLRLNLGPIISAPAAKGNFSTSPHNFHLLWGLGLWRHTQGILLKSDRVSRSFCPFVRQNTFCLQDACLTAGHVSLFNVYAEWLSNTTLNIALAERTWVWNAHIVHKTTIWNKLANAKSLLSFKTDLCSSEFFMSAFVCRCRFYTMQSRHAGYFYSLPTLPLSLISVAQLLYEPEANQLAHQSLVEWRQLFSTAAGERK